jgi:thiamine-phosphate pyrophosphorylase
VGSIPLSEPQLMLIVSPRVPAAVIEAAVRGGVTSIELRAKDVSTGELLESGRDIQTFCSRSGIPLIVNDRPDVCMAVGARGAHVGPADLPPGLAREILGPDRILGVSVKTADRLALAEGARADYIGVGALHATPSKLDTTVIGLKGIEGICRSTTIPVLAIGGVLPADVPELRGIGVFGVAVSSGIMKASDPESTARAYRKALENA